LPIDRPLGPPEQFGDMSDWSRRDALQAVTSMGVLAIAGCSGSTEHTDAPPRQRGEPVSDVEVTFARDRKGRSLFELDDDEDRIGGLHFMTGEEDRDRVSFRSSDPAGKLRAFVNQTDLESESVYLLERSVGACYEVRLTGVYRESDGVEAEFCRALRPADVACSSDDEDAVGVAIRLPFDGEDFNSYGSRWGSDCDGPGTAIAHEGGDDG
jgi:hypothetical protein